MQNDISPPDGNRPNSGGDDQPTPAQQYQDAIGETPRVDERKLEQEFGPPPDTGMESMTPEPTKVKPHHRLGAWFRSLDKKHRLFYAALASIVIAAAGTSYYLLSRPAPPPVVPAYPVYHKPTPKTVPSLLTGLQVDPAINKLQVTGVMIENSVFARPQSGLNQAGIVYEAIAEAGITRFMALFQDTRSEHIGPVRSARPYYVEWCQAFDCALAHVGGSPDALKSIKAWGVKDLDQFAGAAYFKRATNRYAPHNVYTSQAKLSAYEKSRGYNSSSYTGFEHLKEEPKVAQASITTKTINLNYPGNAYDVSYEYDAAKNDYKRSEGGAAHMSVDAKGVKSQNAPKVVIAMVMAYSKTSDNYHSSYQSTGSGSLYVFQNGTVTKGTWTRAARDQQFVLKDSTGAVIALNPGQAWISVMAQNSEVTYK